MAQFALLPCQRREQRLWPLDRVVSVSRPCRNVAAERGDAIGAFGAVSVARACLSPKGPAAELAVVPKGDEKMISVERPTGEMSVRDGAVTNPAVSRTAGKPFDGIVF